MGKRTLRKGSAKGLRGTKAHGGTHKKAIPVAVVVKLAKNGHSPRAIAKRTGADLQFVKDTLADR